MADVSGWVHAQLGQSAQQLLEAIPQAIATAHAIATAAQSTADTKRQDPYGHTLKVKQCEELVAAAEGIDGVSIRRPAGGHFDLAVVDDTAAVLLPIRYTSDRRKSREESKLRGPVSDLLLSLLGEGFDDSGQMTFDQAGLDPALVAAEQQEQALLAEQLKSFGRTVAVGYGSNYATGVWGLGLGEIRILDPQTGEVQWVNWFPLSVSNSAADGDGRSLHAVIDLAKPVPESIQRFDAVADADVLDLTARQGDPEAPSAEPVRWPQQTNSEGDSE